MSDVVRTLLAFVEEADAIVAGGKASVPEDAFEKWVARVHPILDVDYPGTCCYFESLMDQIRKEQAPNRGRQKAQLSLERGARELTRLACDLSVRKR